MCYDAFHSVHNSNSSKSQAYLALTEQEQSEPVDKEQSRMNNRKHQHDIKVGKHADADDD